MQRSLELHMASLPPGHPSIADMYDVIAWTHLRHGNVVDAQKAFEISIELRLNATYFNSVHLGHTYIGLGILLGGDEGMSYLDKAHCLFKEHLPQNNSKFIQLYMSKAEIHITKSEIQQAQSYLADALKIEQLKRSRPGKGTAHIFTLFGMSYLHEDKAEMALKVLDVYHPGLAKIYAFRTGSAYYNKKQLDKALAYYQMALELTITVAPGNLKQIERIRYGIDRIMDHTLDVN
ncbi:unnamed protein product [Rotaria sordida]|uniref:Uncharacterized protein n=1 Tax=Rotaria sordida TaxID=392033 RepID=A0A819L8G2_9BILA|nr:unnamed protein product [Rotaria sordida]